MTQIAIFSDGTEIEVARQEPGGEPEQHAWLLWDTDERIRKDLIGPGVRPHQTIPGAWLCGMLPADVRLESRAPATAVQRQREADRLEGDALALEWASPAEYEEEIGRMRARAQVLRQ